MMSGVNQVCFHSAFLVEGFVHLEIAESGGDQWIIDKHLQGSDLTSSNKSFQNCVQLSFLSSNGRCSKLCLVDLHTAALSRDAEAKPSFELKCAQMLGTRFTGGGDYKWEVSLLDSNAAVIEEHTERPSQEWKGNEKVLNSPSNWRKFEHSFKIGAEVASRVRYVKFLHEGVDSKYSGRKYPDASNIESSSPQPMNFSQDPVPTQVATATRTISKLPVAVRDMEGRTTAINDSNSNWTVLRLKQAYQKFSKAPPTTVNMIFKGRPLRDDETLCTIKDLRIGSIIVSCIKSIGGNNYKEQSVNKINT